MCPPVDKSRNEAGITLQLVGPDGEVLHPGSPEMLESWRRTLASGTRRPILWAVTAAELKRAHDVLWDAHVSASATFMSRLTREVAAREAGHPVPWAPDDVELLGPAMMLAGLSIENLAKGAFIAKHPEQVGPEGLEPWPRSGHGICDLLASAGVALEPEEVELVSRLEKFALWAGRYPVPMRFGDSAPRAYIESSVAAFPHTRRTDKAVLERLYARLYSGITS